MALRDAFSQITEQLNEIILEMAPAEVRAELKPAPAVDVLLYFPEELRQLLEVKVTPEAYIVKPRYYLGSENFAKVAAIVKEHKGSYVSAGRDSHFRLPKEG